MTAGWIAAAVYLFCILVPGTALALGHGANPCFFDTNQAVAMTSMPEHSAGMAHKHGDGSSHDHAAMHGHHHADAGDTPPAHHHDNKSSTGPCCAVLCVTALPADLPLMVKPSRPTSLRTAEIERSVRGKAPPLLYRPPIA